MTSLQLKDRLEVYDRILAGWELIAKNSTEERADELRLDIIDLRGWRESVWEQIPMRTKTAYTRSQKVIGR